MYGKTKHGCDTSLLIPEFTGKVHRVLSCGMDIYFARQLDPPKPLYLRISTLSNKGYDYAPVGFPCPICGKPIKTRGSI
jgi:hypothetical protein